MSASNVSSPWFQGDYRCSSPFRGGKTSEWGAMEKPDKGAGIQADSGVGSMSPSPPKTPTPDYDSLEDIFDDDDHAPDSCTRIVDGVPSSPSRIVYDVPTSLSRIVVDGVPLPPSRIDDGVLCSTIHTTDACLPAVGGHQSSSSSNKKVHFSAKVAEGRDAVLDESSGDKDNNPSGCKSSSSWRDALVVSPVDQLSFCYRQDWAKSKVVPKTTTLAEHLPDPGRAFTGPWSTLAEHLPDRRTSGRRSGRARLVRRSSSLDRLADLRCSYRSPLLCDPDPLKVKRRIAGRQRDRHQAAEDGSSHHKAVERSSCGGPPLKQLRSYSVESNSFASSSCGGPLGGSRARQRSVSGNVSSKKTPVRRVDDEALKRSRLHSSQYELSQDLLDKQVEMLERKYGGVCARKAALTIQRAFRKYTIMKRFQDIANASKGEKRLSRHRFPTYDIENKEWVVWDNNHGAVTFSSKKIFNDTTLNNGAVTTRYPHHFNNNNHQNGEVKMCSGNNLYNNPDVLYRELSENLEVNRISGKPCRTQSFRERRINYEANQDDSEHYGGMMNHKQVPHHLNSAYYSGSNQENFHQLVPPITTMSPPAFPRHPAWSAVVPSANIVHQRTSPSVYVVNSSSPSVKIQQDTFQQPPRDSVSSEDSAVSLMSIEVESSDLDPSIHRGSAVRHSINISPSKQHPTGHHLAPLQRTSAVRSSDVALGRRAMLGRQPVDNQKKIPPQVPKRTSSIPKEDGSDGQDCLLVENSQKMSSNKTVDASPVWKRKSLVLAEQSTVSAEDKRLSNISENSEDSLDSGGGYSNTAPADMSHSFNVHNYPDVRTPHDLPTIYKLTEIQRKRQYRVGLNLFNKKPERGVRYLIQRGFLEAAPQAVARFLLTRKGLSKQMIGEYLGNLQNSFNMAVLECFVQELDLAGMQVDVALRKFQTFFRMPGEAQKIERLVEVFSHRYIDCNHDIASKFHNADTVFVLAFAIIMLNTDLHTPNMKAERRMKLEEFIKNLRSIDDGHDLDRDMLIGIYERIKTNEFKMGSDHVTQVLKVQQTIVGKKPNLALPHRRLVCYCRLYEVYDVSKKERPGVHQREVFLFNDLLMVTKIFSKKKNSVTYTFRQSFPLCGMSVTLFEAPYYPHGIRLSQRVDDKVLITFNARNEHDRSKFVEDLKESILEMDEMENLRIEGELEKQKMMRGVRGAENRDSGVADMEIAHHQSTTSSNNKDGKLSPESASNNLKRSALSNSLLDLHEQQINKPVRRGSAGSLDSGMSISFQSSAASSVSHDSSPQIVHATSTSSGSGSSLGSTRSSDAAKQPPPSAAPQAGFLGGWFGKKSKVTGCKAANLRKMPEDT